MIINIEQMRADLHEYGNMPLADYITMRQNIAKYGVAAIEFYKTQAAEKRLKNINAAVAAQFGLTVEKYAKEINYVTH